MEIVILKQVDARLPELEARVVRRYLFQMLDGYGDKDKKAWRSFWRAVGEAAAGEYFTVTVKRQRHSGFHRLSMAIMQAVFKAQERFEDFKVFRAFVKLGAGFVDYVPNADGELRAIPKSVSFEECSEEEIRDFHQNALAFLRTARAQQAIWPGVPAKQAAQGMEEILKHFEGE